MPIYDYECSACAYVFDDFARITDPPVTACPACGLPDSVRRLISCTHDGEVEMHSREYFKRVIEPEAKKIAKKINEGDENALADVLGEAKMR